MWIHSEPLDESKHDAGRKNAADHYWQMAGDRVLLYLRCLNVPTLQAIEMAFTAIKSAKLNLNRNLNNSPPAVAMHELVKLLDGQPHGSRAPATFLTDRCECAIPVSPPLHRLPMVPGEMASAPWRSLFLNLLNRFR